MKKNKRLNIGFFTCHLDNDYANEVCKGVYYAAKEQNVNLVIFPGMYMNASYNDPKNARFDYQYNSIFYYASKHTLDALVVAIGSIGTFLSENDLVSFLKNFDIPLITIEIEIPGYPYLYTEGRTGMRAAIEHLIKKHNATKIGFVSGRVENADAKERLDTYYEILDENNIPRDENKVVYGNFSEFTEGIVDDLLDRNEDLDAIVFANDQMAIGGYTSIKNHGLTIGEDILVTGYDDSPVSTVLNPNLTTVHNQITEMGYQSIYEVINYLNNGKTNIKILPSSLIVRASCGCNGTTDLNKLSFSDYKNKSIEKITDEINNYLFCDFKNSFFYNDLISYFDSLLLLIVKPLLFNTTEEFNIPEIKEQINTILSSQLMYYFNSDKFTYAMKQLFGLLNCMLTDDKDALHRLSVLENHILFKILQYTSDMYYNSVKEHRSSIWSSMYITRDSLTYSDDEEACFNLIMEKLQATGFKSSYIYIYEDPVMLLTNGCWKIPKNIYLQACHDKDKITYLSGNDRLISSDEVFVNKYTSDDRQRTLVITPLFTNTIQHGLFVVEADIQDFSHVYSTSLQLATSLNFISLMKQQLAIQKKLAISATELNDKNNLLNQLSITDALTGINNRRGFMESVQKTVTSNNNDGRHAMIIFADMDNLKQVNDTFGHKEGDFAIKNIARILKQSFRSDDIIGRIGGDEFVSFAFLDDPYLPGIIRNTIERLSKELNDTCEKPYYIDISLGVTTFTCSTTMNLEGILHNADLALYESKKNKRTNVVKPTL